MPFIFKSSQWAYAELLGIPCNRRRLTLQNLSLRFVWSGNSESRCSTDRHDDHLATFVPEMQGGGRVGETYGGQAIVEGFGEVVAVDADGNVRSDNLGTGK